MDKQTVHTPSLAFGNTSHQEKKKQTTLQVFYSVYLENELNKQNVWDVLLNLQIITWEAWISLQRYQWNIYWPATFVHQSKTYIITRFECFNFADAELINTIQVVFLAQNDQSLWKLIEEYDFMELFWQNMNRLYYAGHQHLGYIDRSTIKHVRSIRVFSSSFCPCWQPWPVLPREQLPGRGPQILCWCSTAQRGRKSNWKREMDKKKKKTTQ